MTWVEEGDTIVVEYAWTGTNTGPLPLAEGGGATPTGEQVTFSVVSIFQGEEVAAHRMYLNQLPAMIQLGVVVLPEQPVEAG